MGTLPPIRFVTTADGVRIAYCLHGDGPPIVYVRGWVTHLEMAWEEEAYQAFFERLGRHACVVRFDARANGLSDRTMEGLDLDGLTADVEAVMDELGLAEATIWGSGFGAPVAITYAARHPERVSRLIVDGAYATMKDQGTAEARESFRAMLVAMRGQPDAVNASFLYMQDPDASASVGKRVHMTRRAITAEALVRLYELAVDYDVTDLLPTITAPTLVLHRRRNRAFPISFGRTLASLIPDAQFVALEGTASNLWRERPEDALTAIGGFLGLDIEAPVEDDLIVGSPTLAEVDAHRVLSTILFTDIVGSTEQVSELGDKRWRGLLAAFEKMADQAIQQFHGRNIKSTGDGNLAIFDGPARAIRCAQAIRDGARELDIDIRAGLHTGEVEVTHDDVAGIAIHVAARIVREALAGQVLVSNTVKELAAGSGLAFAHTGSKELKGIPGQWDLFGVEDGATARVSNPTEQPVFRLEGEYWTVAFEGQTVRVRDVRGLGFIARLLAAPGQELHALDLDSGGEVAADRIAAGSAAQAGLISTGDGALPLLDTTAKAAYKSRLVELAEDLEEAQQFNDPERAARAQAEIDVLVQELSTAVGLGGRDRPTGSAAERARVNVTRSIKSAIRRIEDQNPPLGLHLGASIQTGTFCSYNPDPRAPIEWQL